jgi:hypothetical protein
MPLNHGSISHFELPPSRLWRIDIQHQEARADNPTRQLCFMSPRPGLGATLFSVRLSGIASVCPFHLCL